MSETIQDNFTNVGTNIKLTDDLQRIRTIIPPTFMELCPFVNCICSSKFKAKDIFKKLGKYDNYQMI